MTWRLDIVVDPLLAEPVANRLFELGLRGVETEDRDGRVILRAYCDDETAARSYGERLAPYLASLRAMWPELADLQLRYAPVERQDWATAWKAYFKPARVTDRLVVRPSWESFDPAPGDKVLIIDPAMAFGTGTHETTRLALGAIDRFFEGGTGPVLDVGCGSGILTIAAVLLGATHAVGIDTDAEAVRCSEENAKRNGVEERVKFRVGEARGIGDRYPLVVSNIDSDVLIRCAPAVARCVDGGGRLAVTGIWRTRADDVSAAYKTAGLDAARRTTEGDWVLLEFDKPDL